MITCWLGLEMQEEEDDETLSVLLTDMFMSSISGFNRLILLLLLLAKTLFSWLCNADSVLFMTYMARVLIVIQDCVKKSTLYKSLVVAQSKIVGNRAWLESEV